MTTTKEEAAWLLSNIAATADQDWEVREETSVFRDFGTETRLITAIDVEAAPREGIVASRFESGWPLFSFRGDGFRHLQNQPGRLRLISEWYIGTAQLPWFSRNGRAIRMPKEIVWSGFAVNTLIYAVILWLLIPGPFVLRRLIRRKRGLCPKCAYPMGQSAVCSECGCKLPRPLRPAT